MEDSKEGSRGRISPYNSIVYGLFKQNRLDEAVEFLKKMGKLFPKAVDRSLTILRHCNEGAIEDAKRIYYQMLNEGGVPSILVYDGLVCRFSGEGCVREAIELMNVMVVNNCFPTASIFNAIISGFCGQGKVDSALKFKEDIVTRGGVPNTESYSPLIDALCRKGDLQKALLLLMEMIEKGILPDPFLWNSLLLGLSQENSYFECKNMFYANNQLCQIMET
ncbi:hypothetical protein L6164_020265 [Bauhinia variegata]|nr:hypothetical protein L6164_020265 [Bauhinia variegata]